MARRAKAVHPTQIAPNTEKIVCQGTSRDLATEVAAGRFRDDLFARLNLWSFSLPVLADRREDIAPNLDFERRRDADEAGRDIAFKATACFARSCYE